MAAIGVGDSEPAEALLTIRGEAVMPPSPVHVTARADGAGGWIIGWTRRSRNGWRWTNGADVPLGEDRESYELRLFAGAMEVRRIITDHSPWAYDAAAVTEDMAHPGELACEIRQIGTYAPGRAARIVLAG